jgi:hypothetical protein
MTTHNADRTVVKSKAAKKRHIGGVMIWSPDQDELKGLPLLTAV